MKKNFLLAACAVILLSGCGNDPEAENQREELRAKVLKLDVELQEMKLSHQVELDAIKLELDRQTKHIIELEESLRTDLLQLKTSASHAQSVVQQQGNTSQIQNPSTPSQNQLLLRQKMAEDAKKRMEIQMKNREEAKIIAMVRQFYRSQSALDVAKILNDRQIKSLAGELWTEAEVAALAKKYRMETTVPQK